MDNSFMEEFGGEENLDALNVLINEVTDGEELVPETPEPILEPIEEEIVPEEVIEEEVVPEQVVEEEPLDPTAPPPPQVSPETAALIEEMRNQNNNIAQIAEQLKNQPQAPEAVPELSEEEQALEELKKRMGFDKLAEQNELLKQQLEAQNERLSQQDAKAYQSAIQSDIDSLKIVHKGFDESLVAKELDALSQQPVILPNGEVARDGQGNPINQAMLHDNKAGWEKIWTDKFAQKEAPKADPIVPATAGKTAPTKSALERIKESDNNVSTGEALLDLING